MVVRGRDNAMSMDTSAGYSDEVVHASCVAWSCAEVMHEADVDAKHRHRATSPDERTVRHSDRGSTRSSRLVQQRGANSYGERTQCFALHCTALHIYISVLSTDIRQADAYSGWERRSKSMSKAKSSQKNIDNCTCRSAGMCCIKLLVMDGTNMLNHASMAI